MYSARIRRVEDLLQLQPMQLGAWYEWVVTQELWRRAAVGESCEGIYFWHTKQHEIELVVSDRFYEVKVGNTLPSQFQWFPMIFPNDHLMIISPERFETGFCTGITMEDFLLERR